MRQRIDVIYEDLEILVVSKPAGVYSIDQRFNKDVQSLKSILENTREKLFVVHRLDKDTSGIIVFAKNAESHRHLSIQFENREIKKYYSAFVERTPSPQTGTIEQPLAESMSTRGKMLINKRGKYAKSVYEVVESFDDFSLLNVQIFTGRLHQIRVHLASIGHPLIIDSLYGSRSEFFLSEIKKKKFRSSKFEEERPLLQRHTLHAREIEFTHPKTGEIIKLSSTFPKDLKALHYQLKKWNTKKNNNLL